jgi:hypothetical protein
MLGAEAYFTKGSTFQSGISSATANDSYGLPCPANAVPKSSLLHSSACGEPGTMQTLQMPHYIHQSFEDASMRKTDPVYIICDPA